MCGTLVTIFKMFAENASGHLHLALFRKARTRDVIVIVCTPHALVAILAVWVVLLDMSGNLRDLYLGSTDLTVAGQVLASLKVYIKRVALTWRLAVRATDDREATFLDMFCEIKCRNNLVAPCRFKRAFYDRLS